MRIFLFLTFYSSVENIDLSIILTDISTSASPRPRRILIISCCCRAKSSSRHSLAIYSKTRQTMNWTLEIVRRKTAKRKQEKRREQETDVYNDNDVLTKLIQLSVKTTTFDVSSLMISGKIRR